VQLPIPSDHLTRGPANLQPTLLGEIGHRLGRKALGEVATGGWVRRKGLSLDANLYDQQDPHLQSIVLPKGSIASRRLQVVMNEERIERLSCPLYRRGSMMICLTAHSNSSVRSRW
jgi:hypothetical protein